ncbi:MAG: hypothetical protein PUP91_29715 [Rhizonema sp. PD37]|nr:hypothetical protein [Rhizonema sp. PD37]
MKKLVFGLVHTVEKKIVKLQGGIYEEGLDLVLADLRILLELENGEVKKPLLLGFQKESLRI